MYTHTCVCYMCIHAYAENFSIRILVFFAFEYFEYIYFILLGLFVSQK